MKKERIYFILYDLMLVVGSHDSYHDLIEKSLQKIMEHTGFPCGMLFTGSESAASDRLKLEIGIGDYRIKPFIGTEFTLPAEFSSGNRETGFLPVRRDYYQQSILLKIPGEGFIILLSPSGAEPHMPVEQVFLPVLSSLGKSMKLARLNERFKDQLAADRDFAVEKMIRFRKAIDSSSELIFLIDMQSLLIIDCNKRAEQAAHKNREELLTLPLTGLLPEISSEQFKAQLDALVENNETGFVTVTEFGLKGKTIPVELKVNLTRYAKGGSIVIVTAGDITERKIAENALYREKEKAQVTLASIGDAVITTDTGEKIEFLNEAAEKLTGWSFAEARGRSLGEVFQIFNESTGARVENPVTRCIAEKRMIELANHTILINRHGESIPIEDSAAPIREKDGSLTGVVMVFHDVSKSRNLTKKLAWQATHDSLTGMFNRREFEYQLNELFEDAKNNRRSHILMYMDLDQFKIINDTCGHIAGDRLLEQLGEELSREVGNKGVIARLGGDEFGIIYRNQNPEEGLEQAEKIRNLVSVFNFSWGDKTFGLGVSIGMVQVNEESISVHNLLSTADMACYTAKDLGRNRVYVFSEDDFEFSRRHVEMEWVTHIKKAFADNRFILYSQEIRSVFDSHQTSHCEILLRMVGEEGSIIEPAGFLAAAERFSLMYDIDRFVIDATFAEVYAMSQREGWAAKDRIYAINLSGLSLGDGKLYDYIHERLQHYSLDPQLFCFEITETAAVANFKSALDLITRLKKLGCSFSLDDFGSGLSSFGYLKNLPVDYLKIDGALISGITTNSKDLAMVRAIRQMGHELDLKIIAEYVETEEIFTLLKSIGVDFVQGFGIERPKPFSGHNAVK